MTDRVALIEERLRAALTPESRARTQLASFGIMPEASLSPRTMASADSSSCAATRRLPSGTQ